MIQIKRFICNPLQENCYVVSDDTQECVIIDCGAFFQAEKDALINYIRNEHLQPVHLIATHGHIDHDLLGLQIEPSEAQVGRWLKHEDTITFGHHTLKVLQTPGHTPGSALIYCEEENTCFSGDTLFRMSIGRTDLEGGNWAQMEQSLTHIVSKLPKETIVLSGHGPQSTIEDELMYNPYLRG